MQFQTSAPIDMETLKKTLVYLKKLRSNGMDHGDIFTYRLIPIMRFY